MTITTASLLEHDTSGMLEAIHGLPEQLPDGFARAAVLRDDIVRASARHSGDGGPSPRTLILCGMGGSGVGADLLPAVADIGCPVVAVKGYELPSWVNTTDRVVCVSYSGGTAETLSCFDAAQGRSVVAAVITTGGELAARARAGGVPVVHMPEGFQPRAAVGVLFGAIVGVADALGLVTDGASVVERAALGARRVVGMHEHATEPPALDIAMEIGDATPVIYGAGITAPVAWRWKAQINENAKMPAFANTYPELDHNEIVGWERAPAGGARWALVELRPPAMLEALERRFTVTADIIARELHARITVQPEAADAAEAVFELVVWGDYVSTYLALLHGVDPTPVERIRQLKEHLAGL
jgi:glucose/mannose-6-phosphate isomerase